VDALVDDVVRCAPAASSPFGPEAATQWPWSSIHFPELVTPWPVSPPVPLKHWIKTEVSQDDLEAIRHSVARQTPFGSTDWVTQVASDLGLESTLRCRGRPGSASNARLMDDQLRALMAAP
jgi:hypothetical protein